jgi:AcrR family transcriptional regulator
MDEAAIELFAAKGLARTTIREIAETAGVTEGALYRHYTGKNDMAARLFSREVERFSTAFEGVLFERPADFDERLRNAVRFIYEYYRDYPVSFSFVVLTQHGFPADELLDESYNPNDMAVRFVEREMAAGNIRRGDAVVTAALLMGAVLQPVVMHRYGRVTSHPVESAGEVAAACLRLLGREGQGRAI